MTEVSKNVKQSTTENSSSSQILGIFEKFLALWVFGCMAVGTIIGYIFPSLPIELEKLTIYQIWLPGVVLVWFMVYPMMLRVEWSVLKNQISQYPGGLILTTIVNWAIQPFLMYALAILFFNVLYKGILDPATGAEYVAGAVILGGSPCTAMVFVWSSLAKGNPTYTLVQVVLNDLILLALYVPTVMFLLSMSNITLPFGTVILSVALFVVIPGVLGIITHTFLTDSSLDRIERIFKPISAISLLLLVTFIFISQASVIVENWLHVILIAVPLIVQIAIVFSFTYGTAYFFKIQHNIAGPAAFIGSSNFFELAVALSLSLYGPRSGSVLVSVVGVLVEVPVMLMEVRYVNSTEQAFDKRCNVSENDEYHHDKEIEIGTTNTAVVV